MAQKFLFICVGAVLALTGGGYWWLRWNGFIVAALAIYFLLLAFFVGAWLASGRSEFISIG